MTEELRSRQSAQVRFFRELAREAEARRENGLYLCDGEKLLQEAAEKACVQKMAIQDLAAQAGITVSDEDYDKFVSENEMTDETVEQYGKPYIIQQYILPDKVKEYIKEHVTVE